jgi:protein phosphatase
MGSRAIVIVCRNHEVARERFGVLEDEGGICYTRTGRRFFEDAALERELLATVRTALDAAGFWKRLNTDSAIHRYRASSRVGRRGWFVRARVQAARRPGP